MNFQFKGFSKKRKAAAISEDFLSSHEETLELKGPLVIPLKTSEPEKMAEDGPSNDVGKKKQKPLLQASLAPELLRIHDIDERYKVDVSLRADDVNFKSDTYKMVPVEEFGAAMLRGMGWSGSLDDEQSKKLTDKVIPRDYRLGLGALSKPPGMKNGSSRAGNGAKQVVEKEWSKKVQHKLQHQILTCGDIVWLRTPIYAGRRAEVIIVSGVPGLNKIRIRMESDGAEVDVSRNEAVLVTQSELEEKPYSQLHRSLNKEALSVDSVSNEVFASSSSGSSQKQRGSKSWLRKGLRVKIVSKKLTWRIAVKGDINNKVPSDSNGAQFYLQKGVVSNVSSAGETCSIKLDQQNGIELEDVEARHLETCLPPCGDLCVILRGNYVGKTARVIEKNRDLETVKVELVHGLTIVTLSMDDISDFVDADSL